MTTRTNAEWVSDLIAQGDAQAAAIVDLRLFLLRAALYAFSRGDLSHLSHHEIEQLAEDCAQDALLAVLKHVHEFRSDSKFTTWAYKFAINFALVAARRERWKSVSLDQFLEEAALPEWPIHDEGPAGDPDRAAQQADVWATIHEVMDQELTERQRQVLKAMVFDEAPLDEVARHFHSNRNAIYKLVHDARRKLKTQLQARGFDVQEVLGLFSANG